MTRGALTPCPPARSKSRFTATLALCFLLATGCVTSARDSGLAGTFRGRWWNHYERGRMLQDSGQWEKAERDLRIALAARGTDQLWPRTYGLHFLPEYFPHRELGITLYHDGRIDEAVAELERSLDQQYSARAAFYLNEARRRHLEARGAQADLPRIALDSSSSGGPVGAIEFAVSGTAHSGNYVARIRVDGEILPLRVSAPDVPFSHPVELRHGPNEIEVDVEDLAGRTARTVLRVECDLDGPVVSFDPAGSSGRYSGIAFDPSGVETLTVEGRNVALTRQTDGHVEFEWWPVEPGADAAAARYECRDSLGNVTRGWLPKTGVLAALRRPFPFAAVGLDAPRGRMPALYAQATPDSGAGPEVAFVNLRDGQQYLLDEIVVVVRVSSREPVAAAVDGASLRLLQGRAVQYASRRISLRPGTNVIRASVLDRLGREYAVQVALERGATPAEESVNRLRLAPLGVAWQGGPAGDVAESEFLLQELTAALDTSRRFALLDRTLLGDILTEQRLSALLSSREERLAMGRVQTAETLLVARARRDSYSIEVVAEAFSTETGLALARADVAGHADTPEDLAALANDLGLLVVQEFPQVRGEVSQVRAGRFSDTLPARMPVLALVDRRGLVPSSLPDGAWNLVRDEFERTLAATGMVSLAARDEMERIAAEHHLGGLLGRPEERLASGRFAAVDAFLRLGMRKVPGGVRAEIELIDAASSLLLRRMEAAAPSLADDDLRRVGHELVRQLTVLPLATRGAELDDDERNVFIATLNNRNRVRESTKFLVLRPGAEIVDPQTRQVLGRETQVVAEGLVRSVNARQSTAATLPMRLTTGGEAIAVGDIVVTK